MEKKNILTNYIYGLKEEGFFSEFSSEHFLLRLFNNECNLFKKYRENLFGEINSYVSYDEEINAFNFLANFNKMVMHFEKAIGRENLKCFFDNQLSAGKSNYDESQFIRALSEMHIVVFATAFGDEKEVIYEPNLGDNGANPEVRIRNTKGCTFDIEVKTAGFYDEVPSGLTLKPNMILSQESIQEIKEYCQQNTINFKYPRVKKIKDFINSAGKKFGPNSDKNHLNILIINWTYNNFWESGISEPVTTISNPVTGIFYNEEAARSIEIDLEALNRIDAIVVYRDNPNSLLFSGFVNIFEGHSFRCIVNPISMHKKDLLFDILHMRADNDEYIDFWPTDFKSIHLISKECADKHSRYIFQVLKKEINRYNYIDKQFAYEALMSTVFFWQRP